MPEELGGKAGGSCHLECDPQVTSSCPGAAICDALSTAPTEGICRVECATDADCGVGRACFVGAGACIAFCARPSDCRSGVCDPYNGYCANAHANPTGGGFLAPCTQDTDCKSLFCAPPNDPWLPNRCNTDCRAGASTCPEGGVCAPFSGNYGSCVPPCNNGACPTGLTCQGLTGIATPVCLI